MSALYDAFADLATARQQALDARQKRLDEQAIAEARRFRVPALGADQVEYLWATDCEVDIVCHLDYTAEEEAQHYGDAPYPGCPEDMTLCAAYVRGVDIMALLSDEQITRIEEAALLARSTR
jgi:hypothetical protein